MGETIKPLEQKYSHNPNSREYILFPEEYFSGASCSIFFAHKPIVDITGLQFMMQEQMKPVYSYASRTFDEVAIGNRIVTGTFKVAFKEAGLLNSILDEIENYKVDANAAAALFTEGEDIPAWVGEAGYTPELLLGMSMMNDPTVKDSDISEVKVYFLGNRMFFPPDQPARIIKLNGEDRCWIPIMFMLENIGYTHAYDDLAGVHSWINRDGSTVITINLNTKDFRHNGKQLSIPFQVIDDRTFVPVAMFFQELGYTVSWVSPVVKITI
jgi:hypothetical protein